MNGIHVSQMSGNAQSANHITLTEKENNIPYGYCFCGCGQKTPLAKHTSTRDKTVKGFPTRYLVAHSLKPYQGNREKSNNWKGGIALTTGYFKILMPEHPNNCCGYVPIQNIVAEKAMGKYLPKKAIVHHINKIRTDNRNTNLVVCESAAYHNVLHRRETAYKACNNANWKSCRYCKKYDDPKNMYKEPPSKKRKETASYRHRSCFTAYMREFKKKRNNAHLKDNPTAKT